jgi:hypothetical protein
MLEVGSIDISFLVLDSQESALPGKSAGERVVIWLVCDSVIQFQYHGWNLTEPPSSRETWTQSGAECELNAVSLLGCLNWRPDGKSQLGGRKRQSGREYSCGLSLERIHLCHLQGTSRIGVICAQSIYRALNDTRWSPLNVQLLSTPLS